MALTEEQREIALTVNRSMDKRNAFGNFEAFCVEFAARFLAALPKQEPVYYQWRRKADPWSTSFIFSNEAKATSDDSEVRQLYTEATIAQPASAPSGQKPVVLPFAIFDQEIADLRRFHECAMDDEGYDVPKDRMKRLAEIGLVRRASGNYYEHTDFGLAVLNGDFDTASKPDYKAQRDALLDFADHIATAPQLSGTGWQEMAQMVVASVKGGAR